MDIIHAEKYYKQVHERFPNLSMSQIRSIITYGLRSFFGHTVIGGDVLIKANYFTGYCGKLFMKDETFKRYALIKRRIKCRIRYKRIMKYWDGRYYFGMTQKQYDSIEYTKKNKKQKKKNLHFEKLYIFKSYEECSMFKYAYIFEIKRKDDMGFVKKLENVTIQRYNLIAKRNKDGKLEPVGKNNSIWKKRA